MSESNDNAVQRAWQNQPVGTDPGDVRGLVERHIREQQRRTRAFLASASIIVPSYIAAFWFFPDLRVVASVGLAVGAVLAWRVSRASSPVRDAGAELPCLAHEIRVLEGERDYYRSLPRWVLGPVIVSQVVIINALLTNPRFERNAWFPLSLTAFIFTVIAVLTFIYRRSRKMLGEVERELSVLAKRVEA